MTSAQRQFAAFTDYLFTTPAWRLSLTLSIVVGVFVGVAAFATGGIVVDAERGLLLVGLPTAITAVVTSLVDSALGGELTLDRSSMLALACEVVLAGLVVAVSLGGFGRRLVVDVFLVALGIALALRVLVVFSISRMSFRRATIPASVQTLATSLVLFAPSGFASVHDGTISSLTLGGISVAAFVTSDPVRGVVDRSVTLVGPSDLGLLVLISSLYVVSVYTFVRFIDRPVKRAFGVTAFGFVHGFVAHLGGSSVELEAFFSELGEPVLAPVAVLSFRRIEGTDEPTEKARFVLPMVHPGPLGEVGGGTLPRRIAETTEGLAFPAHAAADFDFNVVSQADVSALLEAAERAGDRIVYASSATPSVRAVAGDAKLLGQAFGDGVLLVSTFAPKLTDDIDYGIGLAAASEARASGLDDVLFVDAHNCNDGVTVEGEKHAPPGSERSFELLSLVGETAAKLAAAERTSVRLGVATDPTPWSIEDGIGPLGIRVAVVAVGEQTTAYVLIDGNNMELGLRERVIESLDSVDAAEVMTTDTHVVNRVNSTKQVGEDFSGDELVDLIDALVDDAIADLESVEVGTATERAEVTVFGTGRTEAFASHGVGVLLFASVFAVCVGTAVTVLSLWLLVTA